LLYVQTVKAALKSLLATKVTSALVAETMAALKELAIFNSIWLVWVPGISGNEDADRLEGQVLLTPYIRPEPVLGVSTTTTMRNALKQWSVWEQQRKWNLTSDVDRLC